VRPIFHRNGVFLAAVLVALAYTLATDHTWEDYWITFRSSKNLALGEGLVHQAGERLHTFTSPLGVLLPALCSWVTGTQSDMAALWFFRLMCIAAFGGAAALAFATVQGAGFHRLASAFVVAALLTDNKSQDFSANGMETSLLVLFIAWSAWALFACRTERSWLHLGLAWGGLMWTRPDSFVTIGGLGIGVLLFGSAASGRSRKEWLRLLTKAALVCTTVYLPWFIGAWIYYGSPVPHTVTAKGAISGSKSLWGFLWTFVSQPVKGLMEAGVLEAAFGPSNIRFGGWSWFVGMCCRAVAVVTYIVWLVPIVRWQARVCSFVFALFVAYLDYFPAYPASWYLPGPVWLGVIGLAGLFELLLKQGPSIQKLALSAAAAWLLMSVWMSFASGRVFAAQQRIIDAGNRKNMGLWLKQNANPDDTVFMECLGYIGYYSGLRTHDWPGLSSPEVVRLNRECQNNWSCLLAKLKPDWVVLRPQEVVKHLPTGLSTPEAPYELVKVFDVTPELERLDIQGQGLLSFDSCFFLFQKKEVAR
jgi:hypothetical protein